MKKQRQVRINWNCFFMNSAASKALSDFAYKNAPISALLRNCLIEDARRVVRQMRDSNINEDVFRERCKPFLRRQGFRAPKKK